MPWNERHGTTYHFARKTDLSLVPHDHCTFTSGFKIWEQARLSWHHTAYNRIVLSECVLWILLFSRVAKGLLDDGTDVVRTWLIEISGIGILLTFFTITDKFASSAWR